MGVASTCNDFTGVSKSFNQAIANASGVVRQGQIGDREVRVTFAGQLLAATVMPSFAQFCPGPAGIARGDRRVESKSGKGPIPTNL